VLLRRDQYRWADDGEKSTTIARLIVATKIANARSVLMRELRNHGDSASLQSTVEKLSTSIRRAQHAASVEEVMGIEGDAANSYFAVFNELIHLSG
jgi:CRISPR-associated protein Cas1